MGDATEVEAGRTGPAGENPLPLPVRAAALGLLYYALARLGLAFVIRPENFAAIWPASGLLLGVLLVAPLRSWPPFVAAAFAAVTLANLRSGVPLTLSAAFAFANCLESVAAAGAVRRLLGRPATLESLRDVATFVGAAVLGTNAATALVGAAVVHWGAGGPFWASGWVWWLEDGLGMLVVAPAVVALARWASEGGGAPGPGHRALWLATCGAAAAVAALVFLIAPAVSFGWILRPYLLLPVLYFAALRLGAPGAALGGVIATAAALWGLTVHGDLFGWLGHTLRERLLGTQAFLAVVTGSAHFFAAFATEWKEAVAALKESEGRARLAAEAAGFGTYGFEFAGARAFYSPEFLSLYGLPPDARLELDGDLVPRALHPDDRAAFLARMRAANDPGGTGLLELDYRILRPDGGVRRLRVRGQTLFGGPGPASRPLRAHGIVQDVTERKSAEEETARLLDQTRRDAETRGRLLREINHRVKNNLVSLLGLLLAEKRGAPPAGRPWVEAILERLAGRVRGMLSAHEMLSDAEWAPLPLAELAERVLRQALASAIAAGQVSVAVAPSGCRVSPRQVSSLALALNELATNTLKYAVPERGHVGVSVWVEEDEASCTLEYRDDGPGYPEAVLGGERPSVGLGLVSGLVAGTLRGSLSLSNDGGAVATIRIGKEDPGST